MNFNLITDRTQSDVDRIKYLSERIRNGTATDTERAEYLTDLKGAYNATDLNRVSACMEDLVSRLNALGYNVPGYARVSIDRASAPTSRLPAGYTEVEYIQSSGTQYVDTTFTPDSSTRVVMDVKFLATASNASAYGSRTSGAKMFWLFVNGDNTIRFGYGSNKLSGNCTVNTRILTDADQNTLSVDGAKIITATKETFSGGSPIYLFGLNDSGTSQYHATMQCYSCQIYDNGTLVRDFVPCINDAGAVGLYDLVNGQFYSNTGTGTFTAGDVVEVEAPSESDEDELDPYTWYISDIPTQPQMVQYLYNVSLLRVEIDKVLSYWRTESQYPLPTPPDDMRGLTYQEANDIEQILQSVENQLTYMDGHFYWFYSGEVFAGEI